MKSVLISIHTEWVYEILNGRKTIEIRKTAPKIEPPFKCYIYCTKDGKEPLCYMDYCGYDMTDFSEDFLANGKVVAEFVCDKIEHIEIRHFTVFGHENRYAAVGDNPDHQWLKKSCLSYDEVAHYGKNAPLYGWHISDLVIYDKPKELSAFSTIKKCNACKNSGYEASACIYDEDCRVPAIITRPPQSWCYVEE